jgi:hypothetical protein
LDIKFVELIEGAGFANPKLSGNATPEREKCKVDN